mmetsp:Transcript_132908/g.331589  ORF Transcript_132908/g.331589 Transcript_132908/m.331589 type:complete len:211 (+) Transcript_132908:514-1146(+)
MDDPETALHGTVEDHPTACCSGCQINGGHTANGLPVANHLVVWNIAVVREVVVGCFHVSVQIFLSRCSGALAVAAVFVGEDVDLQPRAQVPQVMEHDADVGAVPVAEEQRSGGLCSPEVEAEDDVATARPHSDGIDCDALCCEIRQGREAIICLDQEDLLLLRDVVARRTRREECHLVHQPSHEARHQREAADAADEAVAAGDRVDDPRH